ncbi:ABC transporter permease [Aquabacterium sp. J223]|uniref:ABC transporter permease n=1 Tax=Aquabacterium sp. J223 TaxID=2898431 RepID=UPI0021ADB17B|nr:ABC transporter permease [Aquabacterium sp. J223]UUX94120.1 ABC transporter permease [Aquabacterium sp. J223]
MLFALLLRETKTRFGGRWLGVYWALLDPLAQVLVMTVLLGSLHRSALPGVEPAVFLFAGILPFYLFRNVSLRLMEGIDANRALFGYRQVKPIDTLAARMLLETAVYLAVSALMLGGFAITGLPWAPARPLELLGLGGVLCAGAFGLGLALAVLTHPFPQTRSVVRVVFLVLYLVSGALTPIQLVPQPWRSWLLLNPLLHLVELSRAFFIPGYRLVEGIDAGYLSFWMLVAVSGGLGLYHLHRHRLLAI